MAVKVTCPACKAGLQIGPDLLGKAIKCPKCKKPFKAPASVASSAATAPKAAVKPAAAPKPAAADANKYTVSRAGKKFGPYTMAQLKQLAEMDKLKPTDQVRKGADGDWESASEIAGLFPEQEESADEEENLFGDDEEEAPSPVRAKAPVRKPVVEEDEDEDSGFGDDDEEETPALRGKAKPVARRRVDDDDEDDDDVKPVKKKKSSFALVLILLLLVLAGGGGAAWWFLWGPGAGPALVAPIAKGKTPVVQPVNNADAAPKTDDAAPKTDVVSKTDDGPKETPKTDDGKPDDAKKDDVKKDDAKKDDPKTDDGAKKDPELKQPIAREGVELKFLSNDIQGIAVINMQRILASPLAKSFDAANAIRKKLPADEADPTKIDRLVLYLDPVPVGMKPVSGGFLLRFTEPMDPAKVLDKNAEEAMLEGKKGWKAKWEGLDIYIVPHDEMTYVGGVEGTLKKMLAGGDAGALRTKVAATDLGSADILLVGVIDSANPDAFPLRKMMGEAAMNLPEQFKELEPVVPKLKAASVSLDLSGKNLLTAVIDLEDTDAAEKLKKVAGDALGFAKFALAPAAKKAAEDKAPPEVKKLAASTVDELFNGMAVDQKGKTVLATIPNPKSLPELIKVGAPLIMKMMAGAGNDAVQINNMKQLGLAMHSYHDTYKGLPAFNRGLEVPSEISWRVALLPFVEQGDLYNALRTVNLTTPEAWDGPNNIKLLEQMPAVFADPTRPAKKGYTYLQAVVGPNALFDPKAKVTFINTTDGTSNTIMFVEAKEATPWTKPGDLTFDDAPLSKLHRRPRGYLVALADGSVRFVKLDEETLKALVTRNGGETIDLESLDQKGSTETPKKEADPVGLPAKDSSPKAAPPLRPIPKTIEKKLEEKKLESPNEGAVIEDAALPKRLLDRE